MFKFIFMLAVLFAGVVISVHYDWHKTVFMFLEEHKNTTEMVVEKTKQLVKDSSEVVEKTIDKVSK